MSKIWILLCSGVSLFLEHSTYVRGISMHDVWIYPSSLWVSTQNIRSVLKAFTKKMRMRAEIRFGAKTIVTSLSCDILCDRQKIVSHMYQSMFSQFMCYIGFIKKIKLFKYKRFKHEKCADKNTALSRLKIFQIIRNLQYFVLHICSELPTSVDIR